MTRLFLSLITALLISFPAAAKTENTSVDTVGYGQSYQEALASALFDAVRQVRGTSVGSEKQIKAQFMSMFDQHQGTIVRSIGVEEQIFSISKGWVDSYKVTDVREPKDKDQSWRVSISAQVPEYKSVIKDGKRNSVAVMPFRFSHSTYSINDLGKTSNTYQISSRIRDRILTSLTQMQQLQVVNRSFGQEFSSEKALLSSDNVAPSEAARIGNVVGADFMIVGNIHDLSTKIETKEFYGMTKTTLTDRIDFSYQVIEVATQKLLWADTLNETVERKLEDDDQSVTETIDFVARLVVNGLMDLLYPVKVLDAASESQIYLNQGQARLQPDDVLALFSEGRSITDPDSGLEIKIDGQEIAKLKVSSVSPKYSIAELIDGPFNRIRKGDILRLQIKEMIDPNANKEVRETPGSSEAPVQW